MKKYKLIAYCSLLISYLLVTVPAYAQVGVVNVPDPLKNLVAAGNNDEGAGSLGVLLKNIISIIYVAGMVAFLFMLILGAWQWITSGGDKENLAKARARITHAIIGIILLSLAFFIMRIIQDVTGFTIIG